MAPRPRWTRCRSICAWCAADGRPPTSSSPRCAHNYEAIGGRSPLTDITHAQAAALRARLGPDIPVAVGMRNWTAVHQGRARRARSGRRHARDRHPAGAAVLDAERQQVLRRGHGGAAGRHGVRAGRSRFTTHPLLLDAFAERVRAAQPEPDERGRVHGAQPAGARHRGGRSATPTKSRRPRAASPSAPASRSYHARVPERRPHARAVDRPRSSATLIDDRIGQASGNFLVVPIGFVCDHTEILFDIDVQAAQVAARVRGASLRRTESLNTLADVHRACSRISSLQRAHAMTVADDNVPTPCRSRRSSSAAASPGWRPPTSCSRRGISFVVLEARRRAGGVILSEADRRLHHRRRPRLAARSEAGRHRALPGARPGRSARARPSRRASRTSSAAGRFTRCRPHRCSASRRASGRSSARRLFSWPGKLRMGAELFVPPRRDDAPTNRSARS